MTLFRQNSFTTETSLNTTTAFLRRRESFDLEQIKACDVVLFGPQSNLSLARQPAIPCRKQPVAVEGNRELVLLGLNLEHVPIVRCDVGIRSPDPFLLALHDPKQIDPFFQGA